jgi:hypothetical protein
MRDAVEYIVKLLVEKPENVNVELADTDSGKVIQIRVDETDKGRVIGKQGRVIKAIRQVVSAGSAKNNVHYGVEVAD